MSTATIRLKQFALTCVALATFCAIALTGLSALYQDTQAERALGLNPFNTSARIALLAQGLTGEDTAAPSPTLEGVAQVAIRQAPINALVYGLLGEVKLGEGDEKTADALFDIALSLSRTEAIALQRTMIRAAADGDHAAAIEKLDILFRRWPEQFSAFADAIPQLLRTPDGYETALAALANHPPWRARFLQTLNTDPDSIDLAYRLQLDLNQDTEETVPREIGGTLSGLLRARRYDQAYRLFLLTLNETDRAHYGYVFNSGFDLEPSGRPFDWRLASRPGVKLSRTAIDTPDGKDFRLDLQFLGKPIKRIDVGQFLYLPAGQYRMTINIDASNLTAPKGLHFDIICIDPKSRIMRIDVPQGSYRRETLEGNFILPDAGCELFRLEMGTDLIAESFRYRYTGTLSVHSISLGRISS